MKYQCTADPKCTEQVNSFYTLRKEYWSHIAEHFQSRCSYHALWHASAWTEVSKDEYLIAKIMES